MVDDWNQTTDNQYEGDFWGLYLGMENLDGNFLQDRGLLDDNFYDMQSWTVNWINLGDTGVTDKSDLISFMSTYSNGSPGEQWWRSAFDLPGYYKFRRVGSSTPLRRGPGQKLLLLSQPADGQVEHPALDLTRPGLRRCSARATSRFGDSCALQPDVSNLEYQNSLRERRDLLFNQEQMFLMIFHETAALIDTPSDGRSMVDADRSMWDYNPILSSGM